MSESRAVPRYALSLPITVHLLRSRSVANRSVGTTVDISTNGLCFLLEFAPVQGVLLNFSILLAFRGVGAAQTLIRGVARVSRVVKCGDKCFRVAASIERCRILPASTIQNTAH
jgi:hypothetical protein